MNKLKVRIKNRFSRRDSTTRDFASRDRSTSLPIPEGALAKVAARKRKKKAGKAKTSSRVPNAKKDQKDAPRLKLELRWNHPATVLLDASLQGFLAQRGPKKRAKASQVQEQQACSWVLLRELCVLSRKRMRTDLNRESLSRSRDRANTKLKKLMVISSDLRAVLRDNLGADSLKASLISSSSSTANITPSTPPNLKSRLGSKRRMSLGGPRNLEKQNSVSLSEETKSYVSGCISRDIQLATAEVEVEEQKLKKLDLELHKSHSVQKELRQKITRHQAHFKEESLQNSFFEHGMFAEASLSEHKLLQFMKDIKRESWISLTRTVCCRCPSPSSKAEGPEGSLLRAKTTDDLEAHHASRPPPIPSRPPPIARLISERSESKSPVLSENTWKREQMQFQGEEIHSNMQQFYGWNVAPKEVHAMNGSSGARALRAFRATLGLGDKTQLTAGELESSLCSSCLLKSKQASDLTSSLFLRDLLPWVIGRTDLGGGAYDIASSLRYQAPRWSGVSKAPAALAKAVPLLSLSFRVVSCRDPRDELFQPRPDARVASAQTHTVIRSRPDDNIVVSGAVVDFFNFFPTNEETHSPQAEVPHSIRIETTTHIVINYSHVAALQPGYREGAELASNSHYVYFLLRHILRSMPGIRGFARKGLLPKRATLQIMAFVNPCWFAHFVRQYELVDMPSASSKVFE